jgi:hypothetical protein
MSLDDVGGLLEGCIGRLNGAIGYITPKAMLAGRQPENHAERGRKFEGPRRHCSSGECPRGVGDFLMVTIGEVAELLASPLGQVSGSSARTLAV